MSEIGKKKKNKKRKHKLFEEDEDEYKLVKKEKRKHKHRTGSGDDDGDDDGDNVTLTLLVSVDGDETRFPLLLSPNTTSWEIFAGKIKETSELNPKKTNKHNIQPKVWGLLVKYSSERENVQNVL